jgi:hypothetical protein
MKAGNLPINKNTQTHKLETDGWTQHCHYPFIYALCRRLKTSNFIRRGWGGSLCRTSRQPTIIYILIFKGLSPGARSWGIFIHRRVERCSTTVDSSPPRCSMPRRIFFFLNSVRANVPWDVAMSFLFLFCVKFHVQHHESKNVRNVKLKLQ